MQTAEAAAQVPLLANQSKQHFSLALHRHFDCLPSIAVTAHDLPLFAAAASDPIGVVSARANTHANSTIQRVMNSSSVQNLPHQSYLGSKEISKLGSSLESVP
jgi:hypothetical protein